MNELLKKVNSRPCILRYTQSYVNRRSKRAYLFYSAKKYFYYYKQSYQRYLANYCEGSGLPVIGLAFEVEHE